MREGTFVRFRILIHRDGYELMISDVFCLFCPACAGVGYKGIEVYSREIKVRLIRAGVYCERWQVESREIKWNTSGLEENLGFRCMLGFDTSGLL